MHIEDSIRDALHGDAAELQPVGPGPDHARQRAFRRKRRMASGVVLVGAFVLVGGTLTVIENRPASSGHVQAQPVAPIPELSWRSVDGTVQVQGQVVTGPDGVTYALSTAPGTTGNANGPTDIYRTSDGVKWSNASLGGAKFADFTESGGVLYAVGTGPGAQDSIAYNLSTSSDGGASWTPDTLPVHFTQPAATVPLEKEGALQVARGAHSTVVIAKMSYSPDVSSFTDGHPGYAASTTTDGVQVLDESACMADAQGKAVARKESLDSSAPAVRAIGQKCSGTVVATHPWSDLGITDPAALQQQVALVRTDGGDWHAVPMAGDASTYLQDVAATTNGFVIVDGDGTGGDRLLSSTDGLSWAPMANVPAFDSVSLGGDRIIGLDNGTGTVSTSSDGGATWVQTQNIAGQPGIPAVASGPDNNRATTITAGPLGFAALVVNSSATTTHSYLVNSADGVSWTVTDLAAKGAPTNGYASNVTVGNDHISVAYQVPADGPQGPGTGTKLVTLLGTPKA